MHLEDNQIIDLYLVRDETAIRKTKEKYGSRLYMLAYGIINDEQTSEECENDTYLSAWNTIPPHEPRNYLYAFLARITRHIALNICRNQHRSKRSVPICELSAEIEQCLPSPNDGECLIDNMALSEAINGFLSKLNKEKRNIFIRRYWYLESTADIAKRFALSESKVKTTLFRCRNQFREYLKREGYIL